MSNNEEKGGECVNETTYLDEYTQRECYTNLRTNIVNNETQTIRYTMTSIRVG